MWKTHDGSALSDPSCKLARPNEMKHIKQKTKDSFNYVTHPHSRSPPATVLPVCRNGHCEEQWSRMSLLRFEWRARQLAGTWKKKKMLLCSKKAAVVPLNTNLAHTESVTHVRTSRKLHINLLPTKDNQCLSAAVQREEKNPLFTLTKVQMPAPLPKTKPCTDTDAWRLLSIRK